MNVPNGLSWITPQDVAGLDLAPMLLAPENSISLLDRQWIASIADVVRPPGDGTIGLSIKWTTHER